MKTMYGPWHRRRIIRTYKRTSSVVKAAAAAGVSTSYAWYLLDAEDLIKNRTPQYTAELVAEAVRLYVEERLSCRGVEAKLKQIYSPAPSQEAIHQWVKARCLLRTKSAADVIQNGRRFGRDYDGEVKTRAQELAARKLSVRRIARELGVSRNAVKRHLDEADRPGPAMATIRQKWLADTPEAEARRRKRKLVVDMRRQQGATYGQIEAVTGLSWLTIYVYLREAGLVASEEYPLELRGVIRQLNALQRAIKKRESHR